MSGDPRPFTDGQMVRLKINPQVWGLVKRQERINGTWAAHVEIHHDERGLRTFDRLQDRTPILYRSATLEPMPIEVHVTLEDADAPEGLVPDPREDGCHLGRARDVPEGWQARASAAASWPDGNPWHSDVLVQCRPKPRRWSYQSVPGEAAMLLDRGTAVGRLFHPLDPEELVGILNGAED